MIYFTSLTVTEETMTFVISKTTVSVLREKPRYSPLHLMNKTSIIMSLIVNCFNNDYAANDVNDNVDICVS